MVLHANQIDALSSFCDMILGGHNEKVINHCKECLENPADENGGIPEILYILSGHDIDKDDPYGNAADAEQQLVRPQYYFISSDAGAPALEDFFWFIENIKTARNLDFEIRPEKFSADDCIVEWLAELSSQLEDLCIVNFDGASEDYHFTIVPKEDCGRIMDLFEKLTAHIADYSYSSSLITKNFRG